MYAQRVSQYLLQISTNSYVNWRNKISTNYSLKVKRSFYLALNVAPLRGIKEAREPTLEQILTCIYTYIITMLRVTISAYAYFLPDLAFLLCSYSSFEVQFPACWVYESEFGVTGPSDSRRLLQNSVLTFTHIVNARDGPLFFYRGEGFPFW